MEITEAETNPSAEEVRRGWERTKLGITLRQKHESYFVALSFTLAGLAVQSAKETGSNLLSVLEIISWLGLTLAGLVGLWRSKMLWKREVGVGDVERGLNQTRKFKSKLTCEEGKIRSLETAQWFCFVLALLVLIFTRGATLLIK
jgi:hypothetical protein